MNAHVLYMYATMTCMSNNIRLLHNYDNLAETTASLTKELECLMMIRSNILIRA